MSKFIEYIKETITKMVNSVQNDKEMQVCILKYGIIYAFVFGMIYALSYASTDPNALTSNLYIYGLSFIIPFLFIYFYIMPSVQRSNSSLYTIITIAIIIIFVSSILYFYSSMTSSTTIAISYIISVLIFFIIVIGLAIFFYVFSNYLKSLPGWAGFIINFVFYIPCLLIDFVQFIIKEFRMTTHVVFLLFILEIITILLYIYIPQIANAIVYSDGIVLMPDSAFLDSVNVIGNSEQLKSKDNNSVISGDTIYRSSYGLSMWIFLNPHSSSYSAYGQETTIFDYGNGKPKITYFNNTTDAEHKDKIIVYFTNSTTGTSSYEIPDLPKQKWNNFVFNYTSNQADLFINGHLEKTFDFNQINNPPTYLATDIIKTGSINGLDGAICNIKYYTTPLTKTQIVNSYNLLMNKNPPTNNL